MGRGGARYANSDVLKGGAHAVPKMASWGSAAAAKTIRRRRCAEDTMAALLWQHCPLAACMVLEAGLVGGTNDGVMTDV